MVSVWGAGDAAVVETGPEELPPGDTESVGVTAASVVLTGPEETGELPEEEPAEVPEDAGLTEEVPDEPGLFSGSAAAFCLLLYPFPFLNCRSLYDHSCESSSSVSEIRMQLGVST